MTDAGIRIFLDANPFDPFTLHMAGRTSHDIAGPEGVTFPPGGGVLRLDEGGRWRATLSLDHVVSIETLPAPLIRSAE